MDKSSTGTAVSDLGRKQCQPCAAGTAALSGERLQEMLAQVPQWQCVENSTKITRTYKFADWGGAADFACRVADLADREGHHPDIHLSWGKVTIDLTTHKIKGLSENDFILAVKIDQMLEGSDLE